MQLCLLLRMARKDISQAKDNYVQSISFVKTRYENGVANGDWAKGVKDPQANANFKSGIQKAISEDRWSKGVNAVSNEEWKNAAMTKGAQSIEEGMRQGQDKYSERFQPILSAMNSKAASLPAKSTDAMSNIDQRLKPIVKAAQDAARR